MRNHEDEDGFRGDEDEQRAATSGDGSSSAELRLGHRDGREGREDGGTQER